MDLPVIMQRSAIVLIGGLCLGALACGEGTPSGPDVAIPGLSTPPAGIVVSNPHISPGNTGPYVSVEQGVLPHAKSVEIRNRTRNGSPLVVPVIEGGLDPVEIEASAGDALALSIASTDGISTTFVVSVPPRRVPVVVRTNPAKGRVDVALNVQIEVVFSEPIDKSTLTSSSLRLLKSGTQVAGSIDLSIDGTSALFTPDRSLEPSTTYSVIIDQHVKDQDGDALGEAYVTTFSTRVEQPSLLFVGRSDSQIYTMQLGDDHATRLTTVGGYIRAVWSPDGKKIAAARWSGSEADIYVMNADGSNVVRRTFDGHYVWVAWSPDGKELALTRQYSLYPASYQVVVISAAIDGSSERVVATDGMNPAWSPDGKQLAYIHVYPQFLWEYGPVHVVDADGKNDRSIAPTLDPEGYGDTGFTEVSWSPDGKQLVYSRMIQWAWGIFTMNADGSNLTKITDRGANGSATWSPDGKWIALMIDNDIGPADGPKIGYISADGGAVSIVGYGNWPVWHP